VEQKATNGLFATLSMKIRDKENKGTWDKKLRDEGQGKRDKENSLLDLARIKRTYCEATRRLI